MPPYNNNNKPAQSGRESKSQPPPLIPLPKSSISLLEKEKSNFSLCFTRLVTWKENNMRVEKNKEAVQELCKIAKEHLQHADSALKKVDAKQKAVLDTIKSNGLPVVEIYAELISPFVSGLGSGHPLETGLILDRNTGVPYLPASSIKGVLRLAHAINIAEQYPDKCKKGEIADSEPELVKYFGIADDTEKKAVRGQLVILDAYPVQIPDIKPDIMNPHFGKYYEKEGNEPPLETELPVPISFFSVVQGTSFAFRCFFMPLEKSSIVDTAFSDTDCCCVEKMFDKAFSLLGFGGKTAIGYGRFKKTNKECAEKSDVKQGVSQKIPASSKIKSNTKTIGILLEEKTKKQGWKAKCEEDETISNSDAIPAEKKAGDKIKIEVVSVKGANSNLKAIFP